MDGKGGYNVFDVNGLVIDKTNGVIEGKVHFIGLGQAFIEFSKNGKPILLNNLTIRTEFFDGEETVYRSVKTGLFIVLTDDAEAGRYLFSVQDVAGLILANAYGSDYLNQWS